MEEYSMKKLLFIMLLVSLCAALEVPEDYQLAPNASRLAVLSTHGGSERICASMPEDIQVSELMQAL
jgi:hypothetical protein